MVSMTQLMILLLGLGVILISEVESACYCSRLTYVSKGQTLGKCLSKYEGKSWCYVPSNSDCLDRKKSKVGLTGSYWSTQACEKAALPTDSASSTCPPVSHKVPGNVSGVENVHWLNEIVTQAWPNLRKIILTLTKEKIEPMAQQYMPSGFSFKSIDPGSESIQVDGVRVHSPQKDVEGRIVMDVDISYNGDANLKVSMIGISGGVNKIIVKGRLRMEMYLMDWMPLMGGMVVYFTEKPLFNFNLHGWANIADIPGISGKLRGAINSMISDNIVFPNNIKIRSEAGIGKSMIANSTISLPRPSGVLKVKIVRAKNLLKKELINFSPYCILTLGSISKRSTKKSGTSPSWEEVFEFPLEIPEGFKLNLEVFDQDTFTKDDSLGKTTIDVQAVVKNGTKREWRKLIGLGQGNLLVESSWMTTSTSPNLDFDGSVADRAVLSVYVGTINVFGFKRSKAEKVRAIITMDGYVEESKDVEVSKLGTANVDQGFTLIGKAGAKVVIEVMEVGTKARIGKIEVDSSKLSGEVVTVEEPNIQVDLALRYYSNV